MQTGDQIHEQTHTSRVVSDVAAGNQLCPRRALSICGEICLRQGFRNTRWGVLDPWRHPDRWRLPAFPTPPSMCRIRATNQLCRKRKSPSRRPQRRRAELASSLIPAQGGRGGCAEAARGSRQIGYAGVFGVRPAVVGDRGSPAGAEGVAVVGIGTKALVLLGVLVEFFAIECNAEAGFLRHANSAVFVSEFATLDDVVGELMIVCVGGNSEVRKH